ncbi:hypothetical protein AX14_009513 [Amanita brunnescens Koide BX004]|nr:hypothetical protein AX14_009513 [Amanita brunnescens Koide BX004]
MKSEHYDVHPPSSSAKLLITLFGFMFGYNGHFKKIGKMYKSVPFVTTRFLPAIRLSPLSPSTLLSTASTAA